jgi:hypothetical protein
MSKILSPTWIKASMGTHSMEQHVFAFSLVIEGTTDKVLQFIMPLQPIYNKNLGFIEQKYIIE